MGTLGRELSERDDRMHLIIRDSKFRYIEFSLRCYSFFFLNRQFLSVASYRCFHGGVISLSLSLSLSLPPSLSISLSFSLFLFLLYSFPWNTSFFTTATKRESGTMIFLGGHDGESISSGILDVTASREEKKENRKESATERARRNTRLPPPVSGLYLCFILYYIYIYIIYINMYINIFNLFI